MPLRVITSTCLGATDARALDALVNDFGAEVRVNYETDRTRLHAKAWLLRRNTRVLHRVCRLVQPLACRACRRSGMECAALGDLHPTSVGQVSCDVRLVLGESRIRALTPRPIEPPKTTGCFSAKKQPIRFAAAEMFDSIYSAKLRWRRRPSSASAAKDVGWGSICLILQGCSIWARLSARRGSRRPNRS